LVLKDSIRKDGYPSGNNGVKSPDDSFLFDLDNVINDELRNLNQIIFMLEGMLNEYGIKNQEIM
jgi:hypothetical protein